MIIKTAFGLKHIATAFSKPFLIASLGCSALTRSSLFSTAKEEAASKVEASSGNQFEGEDRAATFYRNSIRRININDNGRGKFTEHHLLRLIKLTDKVQQEPLLFEAYYNYLGHFTVISSTTVDKMLAKSLAFEGSSLDKVIEIYENHNYLSYFPHYQVTHRLLALARSNPEHYHALLNILINSPLIKFNAEIVNLLLDELKDASTSNTTFSLIVKLLTQRQHYRLLEEFVSRRDLLKKIVEGLQTRINNKVFKMFKRSQVVRHWCAEIISAEPLDDALHYEVAILAVSSKLEAIFGDNLILIKDQDKVLRCLLYLEQTPESFQKAALKYLTGLDISADLRVRLQEFKPSSSDPVSVESQ